MEVGALPQPLQLPAPLPLLQGTAQLGVHRQRAAAAYVFPVGGAQPKGHLALVGGNLQMVGQRPRLPDARRLTGLQLPGQGVAQQVVFLIDRRHLPVQSGLELGVDEHEAADSAGRQCDGHHAAKELPEKAHPYTSSR